MRKFKMDNANKKNIIILVVDAFRPKNLSMFGYRKKIDKNLKKIADKNLLFKNFFSSSNATAPSLMSIFTGRYPNHHGILHQFPYTTNKEIEKMDREMKFWLPKYLKEKGYNTIAIDWIGMWFKDGFDYYEEREETQSKLKKFMNVPVVKKFLLNLPNWAYKIGKKVVKTRASVKFSPAKDTMDLGISKIKNSKKPFFLFMHFWDTHFPFPTTKFRGSKKENIEEFLEKIENKSQREYFKKRVTDIGLNSTEDMIDKYDAAIKEVDKQIGRLFNYLKNNNLWDNTVLIVLGDHGTNLIDHEIYFSSSGLYDDTIHVPFIMHLPGFEGKEMNEFAQNIDITPTVLDYLGEREYNNFDGKSLIKLVKGDKIRDKVFFWDGLCVNVRGVRTKNKKLIVAKDNQCNLCKSSHHGEFEEYDLEKDSGENENIYSGESELKEFLDEKEDL
ncbi:hypothetical protein CMI44_01240 [Candidatus Pacearchaeota archaeon]|nr:hypothetical protein [Candidatus Pacearchaeota archaeon]